VRVAILSTFANFDRSYSLCGVALEQAAMLLENRVEFDLFVLERGPRLDERSIDAHAWLEGHVRKEVPSARQEEDVVDEDLRQRTADWLRTILPEYDVLIDHDWMFLTWNVSYNQAVRDVAEDFPDKTWIHWVHSAPSARPGRMRYPEKLRYEAAPYSLYVYLNEADRLRYAESIGIDVGRVHVCYNPMDMADFLGAQPDTARFIRKYQLWDHDLMQVYPFSMPRAASKGIDRLIGVFGGWKRLGFKVKLVMVNAHCNAPNHKALVESYAEDAARRFGLTDFELIWTSREEGWDYSVPHQTVKQLFQLSNVFVFPTRSEACSRILQEASLAGCFVIGNESFRPLREFLADNAPRHEFSSDREDVTYNPSLEQWLYEVAKATTPLLQHPMLKQKAMMMRKCARETVWREQFLPILERARQMAEARAT
jgi:glycosyltransferase involved in cell wall biosynthesis